MMGKLPTVERLETFGGRNYLFCMGFELDGGILRKHESSCLSGFFLPPCKSLRAWEDDSACGNGRAWAWAPLGQKNDIKESATVRAASAVDQAFMVCCASEFFGSWWVKMAFKPVIKIVWESLWFIANKNKKTKQKTVKSSLTGDLMSVGIMCSMLTATCCNSDHWIWWSSDVRSEGSCDKARDININIRCSWGELKGLVL